MTKRILALLLALLLPATVALADTYENPQLALFAQYYNGAIESFEISTATISGTIVYDSGSIWKSTDGVRMIAGAVQDEEHLTTINLGCGLDDDAYWYVAFEIGDTPSSTDFTNYYTAAMCAVALAGMDDLGSTNQEIIDNMKAINSRLLNYGGDVAIRHNDVLYGVKYLGEGTSLFFIDSMPYYESFYGGTMTVLDWE